MNKLEITKLSDKQELVTWTTMARLRTLEALRRFPSPHFSPLPWLTKSKFSTPAHRMLSVFLASTFLSTQLIQGASPILIASGNMKCGPASTVRDPLINDVSGELYTPASRGLGSDAEIASSLWKQSLARELTDEECRDLGTALFMQNDWGQAAAIFRQYVSKTSDPKLKAAGLLAAAQALSLSLANFPQKDETYQRIACEAATLANQAQTLMPTNGKIAYYRVAFWTMVGNDLEVQAARSGLERYQLKESGKEVLEPVTICICIATTAVATGCLAYAAYKDGIITRDEARQILLPCFWVAGASLAVVSI